jgi:hypothetical protein
MGAAPFLYGTVNTMTQHSIKPLLASQQETSLSPDFE